MCQEVEEAVERGHLFLYLRGDNQLETGLENLLQTADQSRLNKTQKTEENSVAQ